MKNYTKILCLILLLICIPHTLKSEVIKMTDAMGHIYWASSTLNQTTTGFSQYGAQNLFDHDNKTTWAEGVKGDGIGQTISVIIDGNTKGFYFRNGYTKNKKSFLNNNRIKKIKLSFYKINLPSKGKITEQFIPVTFSKKIKSFAVRLKDTMNRQRLTFPPPITKKLLPHNKYGIKIEILSIYSGKRYQDTCLSELIPITINKTSKKLLLQNKDTEIWLIDGKKKKRLIQSQNSIYQIIEVDKNINWAILIEMPRKIEGRVETTYKLLSIKYYKFVPQQMLGNSITQIYNFIYKKDKTYLSAFDNIKNAQTLIDLTEIKP